MAILIAIISAVAGICVTYALMRRGMSEKDKAIIARSIEMERTATELGIRNEQLARLAERATALEAENKTLGARSQSQAREIELLRKHADEEARVRSEQFAEQLRTAKEQIANMATRIMEQNADKLKERNTENIGHITQPLKDRKSVV